MALDVNKLTTFGDARRLILETIQAVKNGDMPATNAMAIAANMKVLNDSVQVEINAAKLAIQTEGSAHNFGRVVGMGQRLLANDQNQDS